MAWGQANHSVATANQDAADDGIRWHLDQKEVSVALRGVQEGESSLRSHSGTTSFRFAFQSRGSQPILAKAPIQPSYVIRELNPQVHVFCYQPGVQLMARVVLPETPSPSGDGAMTVWIKGDRCSQTQRWTKLSFGDGQEGLYQKFQAQLPLLRRQYGSDVNSHHAYVDSLAVNLCGGVGQQEVFLDTLQLPGQVLVESHVYRAADSSIQTVQYQQGQDIRPSRIRVGDGDSVIKIDDREFVLQAIEYNGEAMGGLRQMGFNTLWMSSPPTLAQLQRAKENELWIIAPPPVESGLPEIDFQYDVVLAWLVGDEVHWSDQAVVKQRIDLIRQSDVREGRPTLVRVRTGMADYSRAADIICVGKQVLGTSFPLHLYSNYIQQRSQLAQAKVPLIAEVDTEFPIELEQQVLAMSGTTPPLAIQPEQLRSLCFQAMAGGARGFLFRSRSRLDDNSLVTQQRRLALQAINQQLAQLRPWIAGSAALGQEPQPNRNIRVYTFLTGRSRLLMVQQISGREAFAAGRSNPEGISIVDSGAGLSDRPYRLTPTGLVAATHRRQGQQLFVQLENAGDWEAVVLTEDPLVIQYEKQFSPGPEYTVLSLEQADLTAEWASRLSRAMVQANRDRQEVRNAVDQLLSLRQSLRPMATSDDPLAYWNQVLMLQREAALIGDLLVVESQQVHSWPTASPLVVHPFLVPLHWASISRFSQLEWSPNGMPGGDFEDLNHMIQVGWRHSSSGGATVASQATLLAEAAYDGRRGLQLQSQVVSQLEAVAVEHTPIWVDSAVMPIPGNHLVRIAGNVKIDQAIKGSIDGVTIRDSLGGDALQQRLPVTEGWMPFVVYRATTEPHDLRLTLALTGLGTVQFDEITVQITPIPTGPGQIRPSLDLPDNAIAPTYTLPLSTPVAELPGQYEQRDR